MHVKAANIEEQLTAKQINTDGLIAENIYGTTIEGKDLIGGSLLIGDKEGTYAEITEAGVLNCNGANINGSIKIESSNTVQISANDNEDSFINFGEAFAVSKNGLSATSGNFNSSLTVGGKNVLTEDSLGSKIIVSKTEPNESGIIWLCPSNISNSSSIEYKGYTADTRDTPLNISSLAKSFNVSCNTSDTLPTSTYKYTVRFPITLVYSGSKESNIKFNVTATKSSDSSLKVQFPTYTLASINAWEEKNIEVSVETTTNLCADTSAISITISTENVSSTNLYVNKESYIYFLAVDTNTTSAGTHVCTVYYKT